jgi:phosphate ABC transporter phosphate-binding protein
MRSRQARFARRLVSGTLAAAIVAFVALLPGVANAGGPTLYGAGSTWSQIALDQWRVDVARQLGISINYQGNGSSAGRAFYRQGNVDFAVSEIPFQPEELRQGIGRDYQYLPIVAGGTSLMYNLQYPGNHQIRDLTLSSGTISKIFTGRITNWDDPAIRSDYHKALPDEAITPVYRSDGSGTSAQFSAYLHAMDPSGWSAFARANGLGSLPYTSNWPQFGTAVGQNGSNGVANFVASPSQGQGAIGYVEAGYALEHGFPVVSVKNASGRYAQPTAQNVATALNHASLYKDRTQNLSKVYRAPEPSAYPISSYSYMITPRKDIPADKGKELSEFIMYFACQGQQQAQPLGYSPLPPALVAMDFDAAGAINGHPAIPSTVTAKNCPNPTITGSFHTTGPDTSNVNTNTGVTSSGGGGGGAGATTGTGAGSGHVPGSNHTGQPSTQDSIAGPSASASVAGPSTLPSASIASLQAAAAEDINGQQPVSALPLVIAGLAVLALIFGPLFLRMRARSDKN